MSLNKRQRNLIKIMETLLYIFTITSLGVGVSVCFTDILCEKDESNPVITPFFLPKSEQV